MSKILLSTKKTQYNTRGLTLETNRQLHGEGHHNTAKIKITKNTIFEQQRQLIKRSKPNIAPKHKIQPKEKREKLKGRTFEENYEFGRRLR